MLNMDCPHDVFIIQSVTLTLLSDKVKSINFKYLGGGTKFSATIFSGILRRQISTGSGPSKSNNNMPDVGWGGPNQNVRPAGRLSLAET